MRKLLAILCISAFLVSCTKEVAIVGPEPIDPVIETLTEPVVPNIRFAYTPPVQISITGTREENNRVLWDHLSDSSNDFDISGKTDVRFFLKKNLACDRDILIGINGKSMGVLWKNLNCGFMSATHDYKVIHVFSLNNIQVVQNGKMKTLNLHDYADKNGILKLSFAVGETDNYVTFIEVL